MKRLEENIIGKFGNSLSKNEKKERKPNQTNQIVLENSELFQTVTIFLIERNMLTHTSLSLDNEAPRMLFQLQRSTKDAFPIMLSWK